MEILSLIEYHIVAMIVFEFGIDLKPSIGL